MLKDLNSQFLNKDTFKLIVKDRNFRSRRNERFLFVVYKKQTHRPLTHKTYHKSKQRVKTIISLKNREEVEQQSMPSL